MSIELIQWDSRFETGVASIDFEHREMITLINSALEGFEASSPDQSPDQSGSDRLGEIYARISSHFALEERTMAKMRYVHLEEHKAAHEQLLDDIRDIMDDYDGGRPEAVQLLPKRLGDWFTVHFRTHDARLHHLTGAS